MDKTMLVHVPSRFEQSEQRGMTLLEALLAMMMLVVFTGIVALVMHFTLRFFTAAESGEQNEFEVSNGVLIDHQQIQMVMDDLVEVLSQPGISMEGIAFAPQSVSPAVACPPAQPVTQWGLPMPEVSLPPGYRLCLWKTAVKVVEKTTGDEETKGLESPLANLLKDPAGAKPGLYLLQALPESLSSASLPTRRLFCRPRPFC